MMSLTKMFFLLYLFSKFQFSEPGSCSQGQFLGLVNANENQPIGTVIYTYTIFLNSTDITSVSTNYPSQMSFNIQTMQLIALVSFNRATQVLYSLTLSVTCQSGNAVYTQNIVISDINDNSAQWVYPVTGTFYSGVINDNAAIGTAVNFVYQPAFADADTNTSYSILLLDPLNQNAFSITSNVNYSPVLIASNQLMNTRLTFNLTLFLMDFDPGTTFARFNASTLVFISVNATNTKPPVFEHSSYQFQIYNNATINSTFAVTPKPLKAVNGDPNFNTTINYMFTGTYSFMTLDPLTGVLRFTNSTPPVSFLAIILAYQYNNINIHTSISVQITIQNYVNIMPVKFSQKLVNVTVPETSLGALMQLNLTYNQNNPPQFYTQPAVSNIQISSSGLVIVIQRFYYSIQNIYNLTIVANDSYMSDQMSLLLFVLDINEQQPMFSSNNYYFVGNLSSPINTFIIQVTNYDTNTMLAFQLLDNYGIFNTSNFTNTLYLYVPNSKASAIIYYLFVTVTESGQPPLSNSVNVSIDFTNQNKTNTGLLALYILIPVIVLLILILPIILCYYKKRRVYKATGASLAPSVFNSSSDSFNKRWGKSSEFNENVFNISDIYNSDRYVGQLSQNSSDPVMCATIENHRKRKENSVYLNILEMKEIDLNENIKAPICKDSYQNSEKIVAL